MVCVLGHKPKFWIVWIVYVLLFEQSPLVLIFCLVSSGRWKVTITMTTSTSDNPKLTRFRQLVAEKRLQRNGDEGSSTPIDPKRGTKSASTPDGVDDDHRGVTLLNLNDEMEKEHAAMHRENRNPNQMTGNGGNNSNLVAMKKIVARKRMMAQGPSTTTTPSETPRSGMTTFSDGITPQSLSSVSKMELVEDCDDWAMLGNHLEENTTMDHEEPSTIAGSPDFISGEMLSHHFDVRTFRHAFLPGG
jgi:hypothetical protein